MDLNTLQIGREVQSVSLWLGVLSAIIILYLIVVLIILLAKPSANGWMYLNIGFILIWGASTAFDYRFRKFEKLVTTKHNIPQVLTNLPEVMKQDTPPLPPDRKEVGESLMEQVANAAPVVQQALAQQATSPPS